MGKDILALRSGGRSAISKCGRIACRTGSYSQTHTAWISLSAGRRIANSYNSRGKVWSKGRSAASAGATPGASALIAGPLPSNANRPPLFTLVTPAGASTSFIIVVILFIPRLFTWAGEQRQALVRRSAGFQPVYPESFRGWSQCFQPADVPIAHVQSRW